MICQHMGCWLAKSPGAIQVIQLVDQIPIFAILEIQGKWFMNLIIGGYDLTTHINPTLVTSTENLKEASPTNYDWG
jgi:hypothetical protein